MHDVRVDLRSVTAKLRTAELARPPATPIGLLAKWPRKQRHAWCVLYAPILNHYLRALTPVRQQTDDDCRS